MNEAQKVLELRRAMYVAERNGYMGEGQHWYKPSFSDEELTGIIARGEHEPVLRDEAFTSTHWKPVVLAYRLPATGIPDMSKMPANDPATLSAPAKHHMAIQTVDPLEYIAQFPGRIVHMDI